MDTQSPILIPPSIGCALVAEITPSPELLGKIIAATKEMFGGDPVLHVECDPNEPQYPIIVFEVAVDDERLASIEHRVAWHRRVLEIAGNPHFRFSLWFALNET